MADTLNSALEAAFDQHAAEPSPQGATNGTTEAPAGPKPGETAAPAGAPSPGPAAPAGDNQVSEDGKPVAKEITAAPKPVDPPAATTAPVATPAPSAGPAAQQVRAPVSWRPELREKFGALPVEVQGEINRREREVEHGLRQSADARRFQEEFHHVVRPFEAMIRSENADPLTAVNNLLTTAYQLRVAPPQQKAQLVAQIITQFGVDIGTLDGILSQVVQGQQPQQDPTLQYIQRELQPMREFISSVRGMQQQRQAMTANEAATELETFAADPQNEYFNDVKADIADILELAARRGQKMTLQDAYNRATMAHPTISTLIANRRIAQTAQQQSSAAQRAKNASASIPSGGAPEQGTQAGAKPKDLYSAVEAAWNQTEAQTRH
jgi:hypothetical protein